MVCGSRPLLDLQTSILYVNSVFSPQNQNILAANIINAYDVGGGQQPPARLELSTPYSNRAIIGYY